MLGGSGDMHRLSMRYYDFSSEKLLIHRYNGIKSTFVLPKS